MQHSPKGLLESWEASSLTYQEREHCKYRKAKNWILKMGEKFMFLILLVGIAGICTQGLSSLPEEGLFWIAISYLQFIVQGCTIAPIETESDNTERFVSVYNFCWRIDFFPYSLLPYDKKRKTIEGCFCLVTK